LKVALVTLKELLFGKSSKPSLKNFSATNEATAVDTEKIQILIKSNNGFFSEHKSEMILK